MSRTTHRKRYARTDALTTAYMRLRKEGVPSFVTSHEAYRMTDGRVGTKGDHNLQHGFGLMSLVQKADGDLHSPKVDQADCLHDERLPIPGLPSVEACMDCGGTFSPEPVLPPAESHTEISEGSVVNFVSAAKRKGAAQWRVRFVDSVNGSLTLDLVSANQSRLRHNAARHNVSPDRVVVVKATPTV